MNNSSNSSKKNILFRKVLVLNKNWTPIGFCSVKKALGDLVSAYNPKVPIRIEYYKDDNGNYHLDKPTMIMAVNNPSDWFDIPPREFDDGAIRSVSCECRVPTVIITPNHDKMPKRTFRPTRYNLYHHYNKQCFYSGRILEYHEMNREHLISRDEWKKLGLPGSPDNWNNLVCCDKKINQMKGNMPLNEFLKKTGYKPQYKLSKPNDMVISINSSIHDHPDWKLFLPKSKSSGN